MSLSTGYTSTSDAYPGFDWFATSVLLLMGCDDVRTWRWLRTFSLLLPAGFLWHARLFNAVRQIRNDPSMGTSMVLHLLFVVVHQP